MSKHEKFEELCALAATGQLSPDEERRLSEHLDACQSCRAACEDFSVILRELPTSDRDILERDVVRQVEENGFRDRFLARARADGRRLVLSLVENTGVFAGEAVVRRLTRLAQALELEAGTETVPRQSMDDYERSGRAAVA